ncbi:CAAX amino terminal protease self- immunity [Phycisphaerae bacterium RAS1]|nr:CAAX amino terminal protease self- immunity [Phycisphaerae bacterium RAS1]
MSDDMCPPSEARDGAAAADATFRDAPSWRAAACGAAVVLCLALAMYALPRRWLYGFVSLSDPQTAWIHVGVLSSALDLVCWCGALLVLQSTLGIRWTYFGVSRRHVDAQMWRACMAVVFCYLAAGLVSVVESVATRLGDAIPTSTAVEQSQFAHHAAAALRSPEAGTVLLLMAIAACAEEILYRSLLLSLTRTVLHSATWAVVITSLVFALAHWRAGAIEMLYAAAVSLVIATMFVRRPSLIMAALGHGAYNVTQLLLPTSGA